MTVAVIQVGAQALSDYATVPIAFRVETIFRVDVLQGGLAGMALVEESVAAPYVKDYDHANGQDTGPLTWAREFDLSQWCFFLAMAGDRPVGGSAVAFNTPGVNMLESRQDLAVLWDIRVLPGSRGQGIGPKLFHASIEWARQRGCRQMKIETQNINVSACRFYARMGCILGCIHRFGYAAIPGCQEEAMLFWYYDL